MAALDGQTNWYGKNKLSLHWVRYKQTAFDHQTIGTMQTTELKVGWKFKEQSEWIGGNENKSSMCDSIQTEWKLIAYFWILNNSE